MSKVFIHQPDFCPWLNFFMRAKYSDYFVVLDNVQFNRRGWFNRDLIKTKSGAYKITIPIKKEPRDSLLIKNVKFSNYNDWKKVFFKTLEVNYSKSKFFHENILILNSLFNEEFVYLMDLNIKLINYFFSIFSIKTKLIFSSELRLNSYKNKLIADICNKLKCKEYITGKGSDDYLDLDEFKKNNISLNQDINFNDKYLQINGTFMRDLSVLDFYFNCYDKKNKTNII